MRRNAFQACYVDEGIVPGGMGLVGDHPDGSELLRRIQEALVAPRDIVVCFNPEDMCIGSVSHDLADAIRLEPVAGDADEMSPILPLTGPAGPKAEQSQEHYPRYQMFPRCHSYPSFPRCLCAASDSTGWGASRTLVGLYS